MASQNDIDWLCSAAARPWLEMSQQWTGSRLALLTRLRKDLAPEKARQVAEQVDLRRRAAEKFTHADRMLFTARGLEQATDEVVADYKASRFPAGQRVADLCCGIGGDLIALAGIDDGAAVGLRAPRAHPA